MISTLNNSDNTFSCKKYFNQSSSKAGYNRNNTRPAAANSLSNNKDQMKIQQKIIQPVDPDASLDSNANHFSQILDRNNNANITDQNPILIAQNYVECASPQISFQKSPQQPHQKWFPLQQQQQNQNLQNNTKNQGSEQVLGMMLSPQSASKQQQPYFNTQARPAPSSTSPFLRECRNQLNSPVVNRQILPASMDYKQPIQYSPFDNNSNIYQQQAIQQIQPLNYPPSSNQQQSQPQQIALMQNSSKPSFACVETLNKRNESRQHSSQHSVDQNIQPLLQQLQSPPRLGNNQQISAAAYAITPQPIHQQQQVQSQAIQQMKTSQQQFLSLEQSQRIHANSGSVNIGRQNYHCQYNGPDVLQAQCNPLSTQITPQKLFIPNANLINSTKPEILTSALKNTQDNQYLATSQYSKDPIVTSAYKYNQQQHNLIQIQPQLQVVQPEMKNNLLTKNQQHPQIIITNPQSQIEGTESSQFNYQSIPLASNSSVVIMNHPPFYDTDTNNLTLSTKNRCASLVKNSTNYTSVKSEVSNNCDDIINPNIQNLINCIKQEQINKKQMPNNTIITQDTISNTFQTQMGETDRGEKQIITSEFNEKEQRSSQQNYSTDSSQYQQWQQQQQQVQTLLANFPSVECQYISGKVPDNTYLQLQNTTINPVISQTIIQQQQIQQSYPQTQLQTQQVPIQRYGQPLSPFTQEIPVPSSSIFQSKPAKKLAQINSHSAQKQLLQQNQQYQQQQPRQILELNQQQLVMQQQNFPKTVMQSEQQIVQQPNHQQQQQLLHQQQIQQQPVYSQLQNVPIFQQQQQQQFKQEQPSVNQILCQQGVQPQLQPQQVLVVPNYTLTNNNQFALTVNSPQKINSIQALTQLQQQRNLHKRTVSETKYNITKSLKQDNECDQTVQKLTSKIIEKVMSSLKYSKFHSEKKPSFCPDKTSSGDEVQCLPSDPSERLPQSKCEWKKKQINQPQSSIDASSSRYNNFATDRQSNSNKASTRDLHEVSANQQPQISNDDLLSDHPTTKSGVTNTNWESEIQQQNYKLDNKAPLQQKDLNQTQNTNYPQSNQSESSSLNINIPPLQLKSDNQLLNGMNNQTQLNQVSEFYKEKEFNICLADYSKNSPSLKENIVLSQRSNNNIIANPLMTKQNYGVSENDIGNVIDNNSQSYRNMQQQLKQSLKNSRKNSSRLSKMRLNQFETSDNKENDQVSSAAIAAIAASANEAAAKLKAQMKEQLLYQQKIISTVDIMDNNNNSQNQINSIQQANNLPMEQQQFQLLQQQAANPSLKQQISHKTLKNQSSHNSLNKQPSHNSISEINKGGPACFANSASSSIQDLHKLSLLNTAQSSSSHTLPLNSIQYENQFQLEQPEIDQQMVLVNRVHQNNNNGDEKINSDLNSLNSLQSPCCQTQDYVDDYQLLQQQPQQLMDDQPKQEQVKRCKRQSGRIEGDFQSSQKKGSCERGQQKKNGDSSQKKNRAVTHFEYQEQLMKEDSFFTRMQMDSHSKENYQRSVDGRDFMKRQKDDLVRRTWQRKQNEALRQIQEQNQLQSIQQQSFKKKTTASNNNNNNRKLTAEEQQQLVQRLYSCNNNNNKRKETSCENNNPRQVQTISTDTKRAKQLDGCNGNQNFTSTNMNKKSSRQQISQPQLKHETPQEQQCPANLNNKQSQSNTNLNEFMTPKATSVYQRILENICTGTVVTEQNSKITNNSSQNTSLSKQTRSQSNLKKNFEEINKMKIQEISKQKQIVKEQLLQQQMKYQQHRQKATLQRVQQQKQFNKKKNLERLQSSPIEKFLKSYNQEFIQDVIKNQEFFGCNNNKDDLISGDSSNNNSLQTYNQVINEFI